MYFVFSGNYIGFFIIWLVLGGMLVLFIFVFSIVLVQFIIDCNKDVVDVILFSLNVFVKNYGVLLFWVFVIVMLMLFGFVILLFGLVIIMLVFGYVLWYVYYDFVEQIIFSYFDGWFDCLFFMFDKIKMNVNNFFFDFFDLFCFDIVQFEYVKLVIELLLIVGCGLIE